MEQATVYLVPEMKALVETCYGNVETFQEFVLVAFIEKLVVMHTIALAAVSGDAGPNRNSMVETKHHFLTLYKAGMSAVEDVH